MIFAKLLTFWVWPAYKRKSLRYGLVKFNLKDLYYFKNLDYEIVPLGCFCLPRIITTMAKLKPARVYGEKSYPFDLAFYRDINSIIKLLETDFDGFFDEIEGNYKNEKLHIDFIHDWRLSKKEFIKRYTYRIKNFRKVLKSNKTIYFMLSYVKENISEKDILKLYDILSRLRNDKPFKLIITNTSPLDIKNENIMQITADWKLSDTDWRKELNITHDGITYYNQIINPIKEFIKH